MLFRYDRKFSIVGHSVRLFRAGNRFAAAPFARKRLPAAMSGTAPKSCKFFVLCLNPSILGAIILSGNRAGQRAGEEEDRSFFASAGKRMDCL